MQTPNLEDHLLQRALGDSEQTLTISELKFPYLSHECRHVLLETKHREQGSGGDGGEATGLHLRPALSYLTKIPRSV